MHSRLLGLLGYNTDFLYDDHRRCHEWRISRPFYGTDNLCRYRIKDSSYCSRYKMLIKLAVLFQWKSKYYSSIAPFLSHFCIFYIYIYVHCWTCSHPVYVWICLPLEVNLPTISQSSLWTSVDYRIVFVFRLISRFILLTVHHPTNCHCCM